MHLACLSGLLSPLFWLLLAASSMVCAESQGQAPARLQLATASVAPWGLVGEQGEPAGLLVQFQRELAARAGLAVQNKLAPYPRVIHDLASGKVDLAVMFVSPQAQQVGRSLGQVVDMSVVALVPAAAPDYGALEDFKGLRVGYVRGSKYGPAFDNNPDFERVGVLSASQGLLMLSKGRLDALVATEQALAYGLIQESVGEGAYKVVFQVAKARADLYVNRLRMLDGWVPSLRRALADMRADGSLRRVFYDHTLWPASGVCLANNHCLAAPAPAGTGDKTHQAIVK
ncbi:transporter substrate-binding domain-containing protein [Simiduia sp. 21SJ11W-1]|uniref:substrate-binding periplasmic protein n=1 Tax=Simiduia sp. 21SJ11W-1 TaxID=2909669 RepID=UPI00209FC684|nr:transporter substrate-binding domain-containing protein [Simiduia sp. 21SJ11W-1]UTA49109.1 transporter substrate-binding domain-containing protein [Simiduia sp. 21SJ11W-1]